MQWLKRCGAALKRGASVLSPTCREATRLQSEALDQPLSFPRRLGLALHLMLCKWCRRYGRQIRFLRAAVRSHPDELNQVPDGLSAEARERLKRALESTPE